MNRLYYGDCLTILREHMNAGSVDLIYLDPPFNSNREYNAIYRDETGRPLPDQIEAFCDQWELDEETEQIIRMMPILMREAGIDDAVAEFWRFWVNALRGTQPRLLAYLSYMVERLLQMRVVLRPTGSLYLHCDPTASHYIKAMMDAIFGHKNFRSEVVWKRTSGHSDSKTFGAVHDTILLYTKGDVFQFNPQRMPYTADYIEQRYRYSDPDGRRWMDGDLSAKGLSGGGYEYEYDGVSSLWRVPEERMRKLDEEDRLHRTTRGGIRIKRYLDEMKGLPVTDTWTDISPINSQARERLGYATQKPLALLDRIIQASSNEGDTVLDPFCGCATTMEAAHKLNRRWIGIDIAIHAIKRVARVRLQDRLRLVEGTDFEILGVPRNFEGACDLWTRDKYHFQKWAVEQIEGFVTTKRTADGGIDGRVYFALPMEKHLHSMAIEVKGGVHVGIQDLRALYGAVENDSAKMAGLIVLHPLSPTKARNFSRFCGEAGSLTVLGRQYAKLQVLTVNEILEGKRFDTPTVSGQGTGQQALGLTP
ncbi:MAG: site-specific DNA-methyltransferase [Acidobacteria bacterium]|nr:site-specific DNA-methyltransferase [Acidobacteriota bacterium]